MYDLFDRTRAQFVQGQGDFVASELAASARCALLARSLYSGGKTSFAQQQAALAEAAYETARIVTDPEYAHSP